MTPPRDLDDTDDDLDIEVTESPFRREVTHPGRPVTPPAIHVRPSDLADSEWGRMLVARCDALEAALHEARARCARAEQWIRRGVKALSVLAASAFAILVFVIRFARSTGDAEATTREREHQILRDRVTLQRLVERDATREGELRSLVDAIRLRYPIGSLPLQGPTTEPRTP